MKNLLWQIGKGATGKIAGECQNEGVDVRAKEGNRCGRGGNEKVIFWIRG
jgi:hypothetical protein